MFAAHYHNCIMQCNKMEDNSNEFSNIIVYKKNRQGIIAACFLVM